MSNLISTSGEPKNKSSDHQCAEEALIGEELIAVRQHLHRHPELSGQETQTTAYLAHYLLEREIPYRLGPGGLGLVSDLAGSGAAEGPIVALRADLDALPIQEENKTSYRSQVAGVMHACGHDAHTAMVLGVLLALHHAGSGAWRCRGIFQSSEEAGHGALDMVNAGALEGVSSIIALHVAPNLPAGSIGISSGPQTACCQDFSILVKGVGGHAARPHLTIDPIATAAQLLTLIYQMIPRATDVSQPVVVTVGQFQAGTCTNVIPETAILNGTIRSLNLDVMDITRERLQALCSGMGLSTRSEITISFHRLLPGVVNDLNITQACREAAQAVIGNKKLISEAQPSMGAEDFADYLTEVPGCMIRLGIGEPGRETRALHTPTFDLVESSLLLGAKILLRSFFNLSSLYR